MQGADVGSECLATWGQKRPEEDPKCRARSAGAWLRDFTQNNRGIQQGLRDEIEIMGDAGCGGKVGARKMREDFNDSLGREDGEDCHDESTLDDE